MKDEMVGISDVLRHKCQSSFFQLFFLIFRQRLWLVASRHLEKLMTLSVIIGLAPGPKVIRVRCLNENRRRAQSEFGPGPDLIWVRELYRFRPSANPISIFRVISFTKCRDAIQP